MGKETTEGNALIAEFELPAWLKNCPIVHHWVTYKGETYYAVLNWEESEKRKRPVLDLAYCATKAMNEIFLLRRCFSKHMKLKVWN